MLELYRRLARAAANNRGIKLASLLAALIIWYAIRATISHELLVQEVPVVIQVDNGWAVMDQKVRTVDVLFRGAQEDIRRLDRSQIRLEVDLRGGKKEGLQLIRLDPRGVQSPGGARPVFVQPAEGAVTLDQESEKQVPVKAEFQGSPLEDYEVSRWVCEPPAMLLHGPRRRLNALVLVRTSPIDLEGRSRSFRKTHVELALPGEIQRAPGGASNVTVSVTIEERSAFKTFQAMPVQGLLASGCRAPLIITPAHVNLTLRGRAELLNSLNRDMLRVYVDCAELAAGTETNLPVRVFTPSGIEVTAIEPASLRVSLGGGRNSGS